MHVIQCEGNMVQTLHGFVNGTTGRRSFSRSTDVSFDSIRAIVGWTLLTVFAFWTPVALVAYIVTS